MGGTVVKMLQVKLHIETERILNTHIYVNNVRTCIWKISSVNYLSQLASTMDLCILTRTHALYKKHGR